MDSNLEFLSSFDVSDTQVSSSSFTHKTDELSFSVVCQTRRLLGEGDSDEDNEQAEGNVVVPVHSVKTRKGKKAAREERYLPPAPSFDNVFLHNMEPHAAQSKLPQALPLDSDISPCTIFSLFFTDTVLSDLAVNTNAYAEFKEGGALGGSHHWEDTTPDELRVFLAIIIYMGIFKSTAIEDYWSSSPDYPQHTITNFMSLTRFQQLKRFLHACPPDTPDDPWFSKIEPLTTRLAKDFTRYYIPSTNVSIDEMIVCFSGRSAHTIRMKGKPTPEGYKILTLCEAGYTYAFLYTSRIKSIIGIEKIPGLSLTSSAVVHLAKTLPYSTRTFNIYMDNYFSNVRLFKFLCGLNIGACGTVRINSADFPEPLKVSKSEKLDWNKLSGVVVNNQVLAIVWMDNAPVTMLTTIHSITDEEKDFVA